MMGHNGGNQNRLFYSFNLDDHVPANHLLRGINQFLDLTDLRAYLAPFYSHTGRPSIDPELMIRMLIVGYCFGIRSERRLCEEVHLNLAYRWFCRLGIEDAVPEHSTFSKNRHGRFRESDAFRHVFETVLRAMHERGAGWRRGFRGRCERRQGRCRSRQRAFPVQQLTTGHWVLRRRVARCASIWRARGRGSPRDDAQEHLDHRSGGGVDVRSGRPRVLRLLDELPGRCARWASSSMSKRRAHTGSRKLMRHGP